MQPKTIASAAQLNVGDRPACKGVTEPIRWFMGLAVKADDFRNGSKAPFRQSAGCFRGRDASYLAPPAQIRASPIRAHGSHLGYVTARRDILTKFRMCSSACDTVTRYCARPVLC
jgi:hypothetical protein